MRDGETGGLKWEGDTITRVGGEDRGRRPGASAPDRGAVAHSEQRGHRDTGEERAASARQRGEGGSHAGAVLRSVLKVYTHTHT